MISWCGLGFWFGGVSLEGFHVGGSLVVWFSSPFLLGKSNFSLARKRRKYLGVWFGSWGRWFGEREQRNRKEYLMTDQCIESCSMTIPPLRKTRFWGSMVTITALWSMSCPSLPPLSIFPFSIAKLCSSCSGFVFVFVFWRECGVVWFYGFFVCLFPKKIYGFMGCWRLGWLLCLWVCFSGLFMVWFLRFIFCFSGFDGDWIWLLDLDLGFARDWFGYFLDLGRTWRIFHISI